MTTQNSTSANDTTNATAERVSASAQQAGQQLGGQTATAFRTVTEDDNPVEGFVAIWEKVPTNAYFLAAAGSIVMSAVLMLSGKPRAALFVGQWPPTVIALALRNKLLRPSQEVR